MLHEPVRHPGEEAARVQRVSEPGRTPGRAESQLHVDEPKAIRRPRRGATDRCTGRLTFGAGRRARSCQTVPDPCQTVPDWSKTVADRDLIVQLAFV
eukprot:scaffold78936_cov37-Phaeocystis_antarctica.AAC.1